MNHPLHMAGEIRAFFGLLPEAEDELRMPTVQKLSGDLALSRRLLVAQMASASAALEAQLSSGYIIQEYEKD